MTARTTASRRVKAPAQILTPRLLVHQSEPYTNNIDVEGHWETDQFTRFGVEVLLTNPDDSTTVRIGHVLMFGVGLVDYFAGEMAEYYSISLAHMVEFFIDDPLSDEWWWINDGMEKRLSMGGSWATTGFILEQVRIEPKWRGAGWGRWAVANVIQQLTSCGQPVIVLPAPLEFPSRPNSDPPTARWAGYEHARARIAANYRRIGFRNYVNQTMLLDTGSDIAASKLIRASKIHGEPDIQWAETD
ncbi:MAG: hypothetical protein ACOYD0_12020 [Candidatus Nanopelagicales bacterium]